MEVGWGVWRLGKEWEKCKWEKNLVWFGVWNVVC